MQTVTAQGQMGRGQVGPVQAGQVQAEQGQTVRGSAGNGHAGQGEPAKGQPQAAETQASAAAIQERALVPAPAAAEDTDEKTNAAVFGTKIAALPVELDVAIPLRDFRVRNLLALEPGSLVESEWGNGVDVPLAAGEVQLAWSEFEVIDTELVVRVTRLA